MAVSGTNCVAAPLCHSSAVPPERAVKAAALERSQNGLQPMITRPKDHDEFDERLTFVWWSTYVHLLSRVLQSSDVRQSKETG